MSEEVKNILEEISFRAGIYKDQKRRNKYFKEENYKCKVLLDYIRNLQEQQQELYNANQYHQNMIHELETMKQPNQLHSENVKLRAENNRLHSIIKEVREKVNKSLNINSDYVDYDFGTELLRQELLEILDKENNNANN